MNIRIREAGVSDVDTLSGMLEELFSIETDFQTDAVKQKTALKMIIENRGSGVIFIAESDKGTAGMVSLQKIISTATGGYSILLEDLYVVPGSRNMGTGRMLIDRSIQWASEHNALRIQLAADGRNMPALSFYSGLGFSMSSMTMHYKFI